VDDAIGAGFSVRAPCMALKAAGAQVVAVGAFIILGNVGTSHLEAMRLPVERLTHRDFEMWQPAECRLCQTVQRLERPT